ncbi:hypothetical protein LCGC14_2230150, partial [marine sediment metagenome]
MCPVAHAPQLSGLNYLDVRATQINGMVISG